LIAGHLYAKHRVTENGASRGQFKAHLRPIRVQFFRDQHGQTGAHALPEFEAIDGHRDGVIGCNAQKCVGGNRFFLFRGACQLVGSRDKKSQHQATTNYTGGLQKTAPGKFALNWPGHCLIHCL